MRVPLERLKRPHWRCHEHHVFNGAGLREQSEKYNCVIYPEPWFHELIHTNAAIRKQIKAEHQAKLEAAGWTREEFIETFRKSYL